MFVTKVNGTAEAPITIEGDGTAVLIGPSRRIGTCRLQLRGPGQTAVDRTGVDRTGVVRNLVRIGEIGLQWGLGVSIVGCRSDVALPWCDGLKANG